MPEAGTVSAEVNSLLKRGGPYYLQRHNPFTQPMDADKDHPVRGYALNSIYIDGETDAVEVYANENRRVEYE